MGQWKLLSFSVGSQSSPAVCLYLFDNVWKSSKRILISVLDGKYPKSLLPSHHKVWDVFCRIGLSLLGNKSALSNQNRQTHGTEQRGTVNLFVLCWCLTVPSCTAVYILAYARQFPWPHCHFHLSVSNFPSSLFLLDIWSFSFPFHFSTFEWNIWLVLQEKLVKSLKTGYAGNPGLLKVSRKILTVLLGIRKRIYSTWGLTWPGVL